MGILRFPFSEKTLVILHWLLSGCVVDGWSGVSESGEDPGWNLSYTCSTRCCPVLLHRLLIGLIFQCSLPKETPVLKNVLFCVVLVPKTRERHAIIYSTPPPPPPGTKTFSLLFLYILLKITAPIPSTTCPVF